MDVLARWGKNPKDERGGYELMLNLCPPPHPPSTIIPWHNSRNRIIDSKALILSVKTFSEHNKPERYWRKPVLCLVNWVSVVWMAKKHDLSKGTLINRASNLDSIIKCRLLFGNELYLISRVSDFFSETCIMSRTESRFETNKQKSVLWYIPSQNQ